MLFVKPQLTQDKAGKLKFVLTLFTVSLSGRQVGDVKVIYCVEKSPRQEKL